MTIARSKGAKAKCDKLFSQLVRSIGHCENCGATSDLQCAHIISRRFSHTRCVTNNAVCLCARCHAHFTDHPLAFAQWVMSDILDATEYADLYAMSLQRTKVDWDEVLAGLKEEASRA